MESGWICVLERKRVQPTWLVAVSVLLISLPLLVGVGWYEYETVNRLIQVAVNLFECTIRALGGLLSAHALSGQQVFLDRAQDLGNRLLPAFTNSPSGIPFSDVNLRTGKTHAPKWGSDSSTSEVTTVQLEFHRLTEITGDTRFSIAADRASDKIAALASSAKPKAHLLPIFINAQSGKLNTGATISLGARGDSYYEYLLKQWVQFGSTHAHAEMAARYISAAEAIRRNLIVRSEGDNADAAVGTGGDNITSHNLAFVAEMSPSGKLIKKMDHLVCFLPGVLALGARTLSKYSVEFGEMADAHFELAKELMETCYLMYKRTRTGLAPEIIMFDCPQGKCMKGASTGGRDFYIKPSDEHNLLRPETVESLFIMWRLTHDQRYRDWGWKIFEAFRHYCRVATGGYSSIKSVVKDSVEFQDKMESFWLAETLKYLWLLFADDDVLPLDQWVLNTEAHPFPIRVDTATGIHSEKAGAAITAQERAIKQGASASHEEKAKEGADKAVAAEQTRSTIMMADTANEKHAKHKKPPDRIDLETGKGHKVKQQKNSLQKTSDQAREEVLEARRESKEHATRWDTAETVQPATGSRRTAELNDPRFLNATSARTRQQAVRAAMKRAWSAYCKHAWGDDELQPGQSRGLIAWGNMSATMVDALDTLWLMGMKKEFAEAAVTRVGCVR